MPPTTVRSILPLLPEKHDMFDNVVVEPDKAADGCVMVPLDCAVHPLASVTVTVYTPAVRPLIAWVVVPFLHIYVLGPVPPLGPGLS